MLLKALKKAGYDEEQEPQELKQESKISSLRSNHHNEFYRNILKNKKKQELKSESLLVNSAFDDCYFGKID